MRSAIIIIYALITSQAVLADSNNPADTESVILAGGCFWCTESDFEKLDGVLEAVSGYAGGHVKNPTYKQVSSGSTGHIEVVKVTYDVGKVKLPQILDHFWRTIDPTRNDGQFCDSGSQYRPAIFYQNDQQQKQVLASAKRAEKSKPFKAPLKVEFIKAGQFYPAEDYHQDYYKKNPYRYKLYRYGCGRDARIKALWGSAP